MSNFATQGGFKNIFDELNLKKIFPNADSILKNKGTWGYVDTEVLTLANEYYTTRKDRFFSYLLTTTNHEPFDIPDSFFNQFPAYKRKTIEAGVRYADHALEEFFNKAKQEKYYKNTVFVLVADHGRDNNPKDHRMKAYHIPFIIYGEPIKKLNNIYETIGQQVDIIPTLFDSLGLKKDNLPFIGRSLLDGEVGFSLSRKNGYTYYRKGHYLLEWDMKMNRTALYQVNSASYTSPNPILDNIKLEAQMLYEAKVYMQTMYQRFLNGTHN